MEMHRVRFLTAVHLFLTKEETILLLRRFNTGYEDGNYSVIAGYLDGDEEIKAAMIREAREEAGIELSVNDLEIVGVMHRRASEEHIDFFLSASSWSGEIFNKEPDKCDALDWFDMNQLPENVISYIKKALENYQQKIWFDSFGWF